MLLTGINYYIIAIHSGMVPIKGVNISWLVRPVESKAYLRKYNVLGVEVVHVQP